MKEVHDELRKQQEQLKSNIKCLAAEQLDLMNLVMRRESTFDLPSFILIFKIKNAMQNPIDISSVDY
jgi:hypothetical protein